MFINKLFMKNFKILFPLFNLAKLRKQFCSKTIFDKILNREIKSEIIYEDSKVF